MIPYAACLLVGGIVGYLIFCITTHKDKEKVDSNSSERLPDRGYNNDFLTSTLRQRGSHMTMYYDHHHDNHQQQPTLPLQRPSVLPRPHGNTTSNVIANQQVQNNNIPGPQRHQHHRSGTIQQSDSQVTTAQAIPEGKRRPSLEEMYPPPPLPPPILKSKSRSPLQKRRTPLVSVIDKPERQDTPDLYLHSTTTPSRDRTSIATSSDITTSSSTTSNLPQPDAGQLPNHFQDHHVVDAYQPMSHQDVVQLREDADVSIPHTRPETESSPVVDRSFPNASFVAINIDDIELINIIGGGAFGQVWKGIWQGTPVAVKVLSSACQADVPKPVLQAFRDEVQMLARLRHPNICLFLGACLEPPKRAIVTEIVSRGSLWDALRTPHLFENRGRGDIFHWPWWVIRRVLDGTCRGLVYLHGNDPPIIHRDLKSANLLLDDTFNVKICDFGLARLRDFTKNMTANVGTAQWTAPEVLAGKEYSESADMYSLGIVAWELLTGKCPYENMNNQVEIAVNVAHHKIRPTISDKCPKQVKMFIEMCWSDNPKYRSTAREALKQLETAIPVL